MTTSAWRRAYDDLGTRTLQELTHEGRRYVYPGSKNQCTKTCKNPGEDGWGAVIHRSQTITRGFVIRHGRPSPFPRSGHGF